VYAFYTYFYGIERVIAAVSFLLL